MSATPSVQSQLSQDSSREKLSPADYSQSSSEGQPAAHQETVDTSWSSALSPYGGSINSPSTKRRRTRIQHLQDAKEHGQPWAMLTAYDYSTARAFTDAGVEVLLVGDSAANVVYGYDTTVPITMDELIFLARGVVRGAPDALVVADLPFGSYESSPEQALASASRFFKEAGVQAVKIEGGQRIAPQIRALTDAGIPVMAHIGFTPQSVNGLSGFKVQGRGSAATQLRQDALDVQAAGAFSVVMEMVPALLAQEITAQLSIPTVGIGAGPGCDAQVLVWHDMAGMSGAKVPRFVHQFGKVGEELRHAALAYRQAVESRQYPRSEHSF